MAWQDPSEASAYSTGFGAPPTPPSAGGSSTVNTWVAVRTATSVTPVSVLCALNSAWAAGGLSVTALRVSAMTVVSVTAASLRASRQLSIILIWIVNNTPGPASYAAELRGASVTVRPAMAAWAKSSSTAVTVCPAARSMEAAMQAR